MQKPSKEGFFVLEIVAETDPVFLEDRCVAGY
jgi:hypothetical protein